AVRVCASARRISAYAVARSVERARTSWIASCHEPIIRVAGNAGTSIGSLIAGALGIVNGAAGCAEVPAPAAPGGRGVGGCEGAGGAPTGCTQPGAGRTRRAH